jgi:acetolactate synthase-1/2/3 large subunit
MGLGCVGAIAARLARPDLHVVCATGDGAFQMHLAELATAVQYGAAVTWVVFDDGGLGWPNYIQRIEGLSPVATEFEARIDLVAFAAAAGCQGEHVATTEALRGALERAREANQRGVPAVVDVAIARHDYPEWFRQWHHDVRGMGD